jgi:uncharacterized protein (TIGR02246 family)
VRRAILGLLLFARSAILFANTQQQIVRAEEELRQAFLHADVTVLNRLLADDWTTVYVNGRKQNKTGFIEEVKSGRVKFLSIEIDEGELRVYDDTAITVARWSESIELKGEQTKGQDRIITVWMKRPTRWQCVAQQAAFTEDSKAQPSPADSNDEKEILGLEKTVNDAWLKHDGPTISGTVADDFESWSFKGHRRSKADLLKHVANNKETKTEVADEKVRVFGDMAIYTALVTDSMADGKGGINAQTTAVTIVYARGAGQWKMIQDHESLLQK